MITAEEAKELTRKHSKPIVEGDLKLVENEITKACKNGEYSTTLWNKLLHIDTIKVLKQQHYNVLSSCGNTRILWSNSEEDN